MRAEHLAELRVAARSVPSRAAAGAEQGSAPTLSCTLTEPDGAMFLPVLLALGIATGHDGAVCSTPRDYWPTTGWRHAAPAAQGVDSALLDSAVALIVQRHPNVQSLLVVRHGYVVLERYFAGRDSTTAFDLRSATKSITSMLVGIAIERKFLRGLDQRIAAIVPDALAGPDVDPRKRRITLRNLLTMTSGLDWQEGRATEYSAGYRSWAEAILARPMAADPGRRFNYNSGNAHLLSVAISRTSGMSTREFANRFLFGPLGFTIPVLQWPMDPTGVNAGGSGLQLSARQLAKLGYLYLNEGCWAGEQVVPAEWVRESTRAWEKPGGGKDVRYGFLWWLAELRGHRAFEALGYGGQYLIVLPDLDLVVVSTADIAPAVAEHASQLEVLRDYVVRAAER